MQSASRLASIVEVRVTEARAGGLHVTILENGRTGFIPRREISWERRVSVQSVRPKVGDRLDAVILEDRKDRVTLSIRNLADPWQSVITEKKYKRGQIVTGEVVNVRQFGAYVQLEPGVDAILYPREASFLAGQKIEDVLWVGDKVEAEIINLDLNNRMIEISLTQSRYSRAVSLTVEQQARDLLAKFGADMLLPSPDHASSNVLPNPRSTVKNGSGHAIHKLSHILIIDDDPQWRASIRDGLSRRFRATIDEAASSGESLGKLDRGTPYDLVLIDINLMQEDGTELAQTIRISNPNLPILLISSAPLATVHAQYGRHIVEDEFLFAQKDNETRAISEKITDMSTGFAQTGQLSLEEENTWIQYLGLQTFADQPISTAFEEILKWLQNETSVTQCLVIRLDEVLREITITAAYPALSIEDLRQAQDGLYFSAARQLLEEQSVVCEPAIDRSKDKYRNFLLGLDFESYMGISIRTPDQNTATYGLILVDTDPAAFLKRESSTKNRILLSQLAAYFLAITLERASTFDYMRRYESQYTLGQLTGDLIHEVSNKLNSLATLVRTVEAFWLEKPDGSNPHLTRAWLEKIGRPVENLSTLNGELQELFTAYSQQTKLEYSSIDLDQTVEHVLRQLARTAKQKGINLYYKKAKSLPPAVGIQTGIKQVILNLVLNAIQVYDMHQKWLSKVQNQVSRALPETSPGMIIVQTKYIEDDLKFPLEIRVIDNGPGIHYSNRENIFMQGYSGRGGSGLGLYISRNLVQRMGGKLFLQESILFSGSVFVIKLPAANKEE